LGYYQNHIDELVTNAPNVVGATIAQLNPERGGALDSHRIVMTTSEFKFAPDATSWGLQASDSEALTERYGKTLRSSTDIKIGVGLLVASAVAVGTGTLLGIGNGSN